MASRGRREDAEPAGRTHIGQQCRARLAATSSALVAGLPASRSTGHGRAGKASSSRRMSSPARSVRREPFSWPADDCIEGGEQETPRRNRGRVSDARRVQRAGRQRGGDPSVRVRTWSISGCLVVRANKSLRSDTRRSARTACGEDEGADRW